MSFKYFLSVILIGAVIVLTGHWLSDYYDVSFEMVITIGYLFPIMVILTEIGIEIEARLS